MRMAVERRKKEREKTEPKATEPTKTGSSHFEATSVADGALEKQEPSLKAIPEASLSTAQPIEDDGTLNEQRYQKFLVQIPPWTKAPFAYITPKLPQQVQAWTQNWANVLVNYSKIMKKHILNFQELAEIHPFKNQLHGRQLSIDQLKEIASYLEQNAMLKWIQPPVLARIYWKTNEEMAQELYDYMISTGKAVEFWSLLDLRKEKSQDWALLPVEELRDVCRILVRKGLAKWIDQEESVLEFIIQ